MNDRDFRVATVVVFFGIILAIGIVLLIVGTVADCAASGGVMVETLIGYECVQRVKR